MSDRDLSQVESVFHAALEVPPAERAAYLDEVCNGDEALKDDVSSLISAFDGSDGFIDTPALDFGWRVLSQSAEASFIGKIFGAYKVISRLGKGGMGEVYLAEDTILKRKVALKFLSQELVDDKWAQRQLLKEAQASAMLDHKNICSVYGLEQVGQHSFIVMQYVEGETLAELIRRNAIPPDQIVDLARQIVGGIAEAHAHSVIHRDIKSRNVMVTPNGEVKVLDFGLAKLGQQKALGQLDDSVSHISTGNIIPGTVAYMSPEQLRGDKLDYRSDLFSLGIVLYEMVGGKNPFARENPAQTIAAILANDPPPLQIPRNCPRGIEQTINRCLESVPERRYQSATEVLLDLENLTDRRPRRNLALILRLIPAIALLIVLVIAGFLISGRHDQTVRLAVLPFTNQSSSSDVEYLGVIAESLIRKLSDTENLRVTAFSVVSDYQQNQGDLKGIGKKLNVDALIVGRLIPKGDQLLLHTELVRVDDGALLWSAEYIVNTNDLLTIQDTISQRVISKLNIPSSGTNKSSLGQTQNPEAFKEYLLGRYYWRKRDKDNVQKAIGHFQLSIALDPAYALPYAGLADTYVVMSTVAYGSFPTKEVMPKAKAYAKQALEIDPQLCEAHTALAVVYLKFDWNWNAAEEELRTAISLNPDYPAAHFWYGELLSITGRFNEAIAQSEKAKELDPISTIVNMAPGRTYYRARQYDRAIEYMKTALAEDPNNASASYVLGYIYLQKNMFKEATEIFEKAYTANPLIGAAPLGYVYGKLNRRSDAERILTELSRNPTAPPQESAIVHIGLGNKDHAFAWLKKAYEERFAQIVYLNSDPIFDDLRSDPRFAELCRRMNIPSTK